MNLAKSLIVSGKNYLNHCAPMQWNGRFWPKFHHIFTLRLVGSIRYSTTNHAVHSYLRKRTTAQAEYVMGCTVNNLLKLWVCKLSFLKRHPSIQKAKNIEISRTYRGKRKENSFRWVQPGSQIILLRDEECSECKSTQGFELLPTDLICLVVSVVNLGKN
jgi:hypothetical protein